MTQPFLNGGRYWVRVPNSKGRSVRISTGTPDAPKARQIAALIEALAERHEFDLLDRVADRTLEIPQLWAAFVEDRTFKTLRRSIDDINLEPYVAQWIAAKTAAGVRGIGRYGAQTSTMLHHGTPYLRSRFTRATISAFLSKLDVSGSTRNRYRAALSSFASWLVEQDLLEHNPVRDVKASRENPARSTVYSPAEVRALVEALSGPYKAMAAIQAGTGMEYQAVKALRSRDVDTAAWRVHAHGSKTPWRNRECAITEAWTRPVIAGYVRTCLPGALLFEGVGHHGYLDAHRDAVKALKLPASVPHDHRHHYAVTLRRRGVQDTIIARQLGHSDTTLVAKRYGRYLPDVLEVEAATQARRSRAAR